MGRPPRPQPESSHLLYSHRKLLMYRLDDPGPGFKMEDLKHAAVSNPADDPMAHMTIREQRVSALGPGPHADATTSRRVGVQRSTQRSRADQISLTLLVLQSFLPVTRLPPSHPLPNASRKHQIKLKRNAPPRQIMRFEGSKVSVERSKSEPTMKLKNWGKPPVDRKLSRKIATPARKR